MLPPTFPPQRMHKIIGLILFGVVSVSIEAFLSTRMFSLPEPRPGCDAPIPWHLGDVDPRFPLDKKAFLKTAFEAENLWERRIGHPLFEYDPNASFVVTTVFDDRQKMTYATRDLENSIDRYKHKAETLKSTYTNLRAVFERDQKALTLRINDFQKKLAAYNADVSKANSSGGSSQDQYASLEKRREDLSNEQAAIDTESERVNGEAAKVNAAAGQLNTETRTVQSNLSDFRKKYGEPKPFVEGLYESPLKSITVYQFESADDLRLVLAHEFGHALGIDHVTDDQGAIMYPIMGGQSLTHPSLAPGDLTAYETACPALADSPRDAFVRYVVMTPWDRMNFWDILATLYR